MAIHVQSLLRAAMESEDVYFDPAVPAENAAEEIADNQDTIAAQKLEQSLDALSTLSTAEAQLTDIKQQVDEQPEMSVESYRYVEKAVDAIIRPLGIRRPNLLHSAALENFNEKRLVVSTEGIGSFIKGVIDAIIRAIKAVWAFFFDHSKTSTRRAIIKLSRLREYQKKFEKATGATPKERIIEAPSGFLMISYEHQQLFSESQFTSAANQHLKTIEALFGPFYDTLSKAMEVVERIVKKEVGGNYSLERGQALLDEVNKACEPLRGDKLLRLFPNMRTVIHSDVVGRSYLLGNRELEIIQPGLYEMLQKPGRPHATAAVQQSLEVKISADELQRPSTKVPALEARDLALIVRHTAALVELVASTEIERKAAKLDKLARDIEPIGHRVAESLDKAGLDSSVYGFYASTIRYYHTISKWGVTPIAQIRTLTLAVADAVLALAETHARNLNISLK